MLSCFYKYARNQYLGNTLIILYARNQYKWFLYGHQDQSKDIILWG